MTWARSCAHQRHPYANHTSDNFGKRMLLQPRQRSRLEQLCRAPKHRPRDFSMGNGSGRDRRAHLRGTGTITSLASSVMTRGGTRWVIVIRADNSPFPTEQLGRLCVPFRAPLGTGKTKRSLSTSASPVFLPAAGPSNLWMLLTTLSPMREPYQTMKYRGVASVQCRAEMISSELDTHVAAWRVLQRDCNPIFR
jgi:hypothetical protein